MGTQIGASLFWEVNGSTLATYGFRDTDIFPLSLGITIPLDGAIVTVTKFNASAPGSTFEITSVLSASDVYILNGVSLQCGSGDRLSK